MVSWEVKAIRSDRWVRMHGAPIEVDKDAGERGQYQHPELYGQPPEKGMDHRKGTGESPSASAGQPVLP